VYPPAKKEKRGAWRAICVPPVRFAAVPLPEPELPTTPGAQRWVSLRPGPIVRAVHTVVQRVVKAVKACLYPTARTHDALVEGGQWNGFCSGLRLERDDARVVLCGRGEAARQNHGGRQSGAAACLQIGAGGHHVEAHASIRLSPVLDTCTSS